MEKTNYGQLELMFFGGYYESRFFNIDLLDVETKSFLERYQEDHPDDDTLDYDDLELDFVSYTQAVNKRFAECYETEVKNAMPDLVETLEYIGMERPTEYNFEHDRIFAHVVFCEGWQAKVVKFMQDNRQWLEQCIKIDWSSRSGFMSFLDNTFEGWLKEMQSDEPDWKYVSVMLGYILTDYDNDIEDRLTDATIEQVSMSEYIVNINVVEEE